jgi:molybdopterin converting factor small subunit
LRGGGGRSRKEDDVTVKVKFLVTFQDLFGGRERMVTLPKGASALRLLRMIGDTVERRRLIFEARDRLSPHVVVMRNGLPIQSLGGLEASLQDGDTIAIFPFLGGG